MPYSVFISYRRGDDSSLAHWMHRDLERALGPGEVFLDTAVLSPGDEFKPEIGQSIAQARVFVALVGSQWNPKLDDTRRRMDDPNDFVRRELEWWFLAANGDRQRRLVPVLFGRAEVPVRDSLPESVRAFADLEYRRIERDQARDVEIIVNVIEDWLDAQDGVSPGRKWILRALEAELEGLGRPRLQILASQIQGSFPGLAPLGATPRRLARAVYGIGPDSIVFLLEAGWHSRKSRSVLELLATHWIQDPSAESLRATFLGESGGRLAMLNCTQPGFTSRETLLKASRRAGGWATIAVKESDQTEEILAQLHAELKKQFQWALRPVRSQGLPAEVTSDPVALERAELNRLMTPADGKPASRFPLILQMDHRAALDTGLIHEIHRQFPNLHVLVTSGSVGELKGRHNHAVEVNPGSPEAEGQAYHDFSMSESLLKQIDDHEQ
jgi:hypothetical protein